MRWKGLTEKEDSWLPWRDLLHNTVLHKYLKANKMSSIIPRDTSTIAQNNIAEVEESKGPDPPLIEKTKNLPSSRKRKQRKRNRQSSDARPSKKSK